MNFFIEQKSALTWPFAACLHRMKKKKEACADTQCFIFVCGPHKLSAFFLLTVFEGDRKY